MNLGFSHPVLTCAEAKAWESGLLKDEAAEWAAMQRAGATVAHAIAEDFSEIGGLPTAAHLLVLVGKGHNGGDALLAAQALLQREPAATADVVLAFGEDALRPLARRALGDLRASGGERVRAVTLAELKATLPTYALCLDGVFGFQFRPPIDGMTAELLAWVNTHPRIALRAAVDLPSGLGGTKTDTVFRADFTYATGIVKAPVLAPANAIWVGRLRYLDLGFFGDAAGVADPGRDIACPKVPGSTTSATENILLPSILSPLTQLRPPQSDKRTYGHLVVVGGSLSYPGAVMLAVRAALRSGVGLVTAFVPASLVPEYAARQPEAMWVGCPVTPGGGLAAETAALIHARSERATALLIGPGLSDDADTLAMVAQLVKATRLPLVLDADALRPEIIVAAQGKPLIVTPHAGELKRIESALAQAPEAVVVKKGPLTQIVGSLTSEVGRALCPTDSGDVGHEARPTYYSLFGGPVLARGGSGDMLAGLIGGLLAQQPTEPLLAACQGTVWHGRAADLLARQHGQVAVEISQLLEQLGPALTSHTCQTS